MSITYRFPATRPGKLYEGSASIFDQEEQDEVIGRIQGRSPGSKEEWWVAQALWRLEIPFIYQYEFFGGRSLRRGQVLDFLVLSKPTSTGIQVFGEYWHQGYLGSEDEFNLVRLEHELQGRVVVLWGEDLPNKEAAYEKVRGALL
jgi:hypothetical protein